LIWQAFESENVSEQKNKLIIAVTIAAISVILLGAVSFTFFPVEPKSPSSHPLFGFIVASKPLGVILIATDGNVNSTTLNQTGNLYTQTSNIINQTILAQRDNIVKLFADMMLLLEFSSESQSEIMLGVLGTEFSVIRQFEVSLRVMLLALVKSMFLIVTLLRPFRSISEPSKAYPEPSITMGNIELMFSSNNTLTGNTITDALSFGISLHWSSNNTINGNYFANVLSPVEADYDQNVISGNNMVNCDLGVRVLGSGNIVFGNNMTFADLGYHQQASDYMTGIVVDGSNNTVYQNIITGYALAGISIDGVGNTYLNNGTIIPPQGIDNTFFENIIACNGYGLIVSPDGAAVDNNTIYHNDFINNNQSVLVTSPDSVETNDGSAYFVNFWDNNYWSDYAQRYPNASEIGNSGIMSLPYLIDGHNYDMHPLENPYMSENVSNYPNPFAGQTPFSYAIYQVQPFQNDVVAVQNRYSIQVEFYTLPPNVTLQLSPAVPIANVTTTLRMYTFNLAEPLPASTNYTATVIFGDGNNTQSYIWNFTTPSYS